MKTVTNIVGTITPFAKQVGWTVVTGFAFNAGARLFKAADERLFPSKKDDEDEADEVTEDLFEQIDFKE